MKHKEVWGRYPWSSPNLGALIAERLLKRADKETQDFVLPEGESLTEMLMSKTFVVEIPMVVKKGLACTRIGFSCVRKQHCIQDSSVCRVNILEVWVLKEKVPQYTICNPTAPFSGPPVRGVGGGLLSGGGGVVVNKWGGGVKWGGLLRGGGFVVQCRGFVLKGGCCWAQLCSTVSRPHPWLVLFQLLVDTCCGLVLFTLTRQLHRQKIFSTLFPSLWNGFSVLPSSSMQNLSAHLFQVFCHLGDFVGEVDVAVGLPVLPACLA